MKVQEDITWQNFIPRGPLFSAFADVVGRHYASLVWYHQPDEITRLMTLSKPSLIQAITETYPKQLPPIKDVIETGRFPLVKRFLHASKGDLCWPAMPPTPLTLLRGKALISVSRTFGH